MFNTMITSKETHKNKFNSKSSFENSANSEESNSNEMDTIVVTQNSKINRLIEEINTNCTRKQIALLFLEIVDKPEICADFNISLPYYLRKYFSCSAEEVCLSETGVFILCAAKIYSRRVDSIFDNIQQMLACIKSYKEIEKCNLENSNENIGKTKEVSKLIKRPPKRSLPKDDALYESEIEPKLFKKSLEEKICDKNLTTNIFEPPRNYFRCFKKYLEYRINNKKIIKNNSKHDENADSSLYKYSTIEDFDYEDDIDSKRNYRTLHGHIEHRYSTVVPDINFLLHFKVKDFVEEELEEIERQLSLGLPQAPKRKWYSLCHNEYINGLLDLENEVLEKEFDVNTTFFKRRRKRSKTSDDINEKTQNDVYMNDTVDFDINDVNQRSLDAECTKETVEKIDCKISAAREEENEKKESMIDQSENLINNCQSKNPLSEERLIDQIPVSSQILIESQISSNENDDNQIFKNCVNNSEKEIDINFNGQEKNEETIDPKKIIVRLSCDDEGIFLSDLDDIQSAMINPKVVAVDIRKSIDKGLDFFSIHLDKTLENFLGLDEFGPNDGREKICCPLNILGIDSEFLSYKEDFSLPFEFLIKKVQISLNILKFPEKKIRASKLFSLPEEYNLFKNDRLKRRKPLEKAPRVLKEYTNSLQNCISPLSIAEDTDFLGFSQDEIDSNILAKQKIDEYRQRTISTDSGIVISKALNSFSSLISNISQNDSGFCNETEEDNLSKIISTLNQDKVSQTLENSTIKTANSCETVAPSVNVIDVQIIVPPLIQHDNDINNTEKTFGIQNETKNVETGAARNEVIEKTIDENDNGLDFADAEKLHDHFVSSENFGDKIIKSDDCAESIKVTEKIKLWHKHLKPILVKSKGRHHFDVFNLGTEIMNKFSAKNNNTIDFCTVMENRDPSFTSRYFLSMLLLANANNIKLNVKNKHSTQPSSPKDIEIVLLSTKRHIVSVEDNIGMINNKNTSTENNAQLFSKPSKIIKKSVNNEDNDSGFFSNLSSVSLNNSLS